MAYKTKSKEYKKSNKSFKIIDEEFERLAKKKRLSQFEKDKLLIINRIYKGRVSPTETNKFANWINRMEIIK